MNRRPTILACLLAGLLVLPLVLPAQTVGQTAPEFTAPDAANNFLSLTSLRGQVVIVYFWAAWCAPCKRYMPELRRLDQTWRARGVTVMPIGMSGTHGKDQDWLRDNGFTFPCAVFTGGWFTGAWTAVDSIPFIAIVDRGGTVRWLGKTNVPESILGDIVNGNRHD